MFVDIVEDEAALDAVLGGPPSPIARGKEITSIDGHCRDYIARTPFLVLATSSLGGTCHATPRGGPPGFVRVLDEHHFAIPDYTGNKRAEAHRDILANPAVQLLFLLPGMGEALRVSGTAVLTTEPALLDTLTTGGTKPPRLALGVTVATAYLQCAKALRRSELWNPDRWPAPDDLPSAAQIFRDHLADGTTAADVQHQLDVSYRDRAW